VTRIGMFACCCAVLLASSLTPSLAGTPEEAPARDVLCRINDEPITLKDFELALFWNERTLVQKDVLDFLIQERVVLQEVANKGVIVKASDVDEFMADLDRNIRAVDKTKTLGDYLASQGMDMEFFRRKTESTLGLCRLAGGQGRAYEATQKPDVRAKMNDLVARLMATARIETNPDKLDAGVAATVGGERIGIEEAGRVARMVFGEELKKKHLKDLQALVLVRQELRRRGMELTAADLDYQLELLCAKRAGDVGEKNVSLGDVLRSMGRDPQILRRQTDFQARAMLTKLVRTEVTEGEARKLFDADPARFGDGVPKASHIMLRSTDGQGRPLAADADLKVRARAQALREKLTTGEDFAATAARFSDDKDTSDRGGNLGFLDKARIADPVVAAAYALKVGEISPPVRGAAGWHLVKVMEIKRVPFEQARDEARAQCVADRSAQLLRELGRKARIEPGLARL